MRPGAAEASLSPTTWPSSRLLQDQAQPWLLMALNLDLILIRVLHPGLFPQDRTATWANDAPLETVVNRSVPKACGPNMDQARPARGGSGAPRRAGQDDERDPGEGARQAVPVPQVVVVTCSAACSSAGLVGQASTSMGKLTTPIQLTTRPSPPP